MPAAESATVEAAQVRAASGGERALFGHPAALTFLFLSAMWEIFALVGMRSVLVYYLVQQLSFTEQHAVRVYGFSTSAAFFAALIGGVLADRYLGAWRAALLGAGLLGVGLFALAFEPLLYPGLAIAALGSGLFKPTMLAQVGLLYAHDDPRRDRAYNVYAVGCNIGATAAPIVCGALGAAYGWRSAFIAAGAGMAVSAAILVAGRSLLPSRPRASLQAETASADMSAAGAPRRTLILLAFVWIAAVFFFAAYGQLGGTVALWFESEVDRNLRLGGGSFSVPAAWFQSLNPLLIFLLVPLVNRLWARDAAPVSIGRDTRKMAIGGVHMALSFGILAAAAHAAGEGGGVHPLWPMLAVVPYTLGELYLNNIGQSLFGRVALKGLVSIFMGIWILTLMAGYAVSGWLGQFWSVLAADAFFGLVAAIALCSAVILAAVRRFAVRA